MVKKSVLFVVIGILLLLVAGGSALGFITGKKVTVSESVNQYVLTQDVSAGQSIAGKYVQSSRPKSNSVSTDKLVIDEELLKVGVAVVNMYKSQSVTKSSITTLENLDRNLVFNMPVTVESALANAAQNGDVVAIKIKFKEEKKDGAEVSATDEVVISQIRIIEKRTTNGQSVTDEKSAPAYLMFDVTNEEMDRLNDASKKGLLYITKYRDLESEPLKEDYKIN